MPACASCGPSQAVVHSFLLDLLEVHDDLWETIASQPIACTVDNFSGPPGASMRRGCEVRCSLPPVLALRSAFCGARTRRAVPRQAERTSCACAAWRRAQTVAVAGKAGVHVRPDGHVYRGSLYQTKSEMVAFVKR